MQNSSTPPFPTILLCITEDWFALSHFRPLIQVLRTLSGRLVVATNVGEGRAALEALGAEVRPFDFSRAPPRRTVYHLTGAGFLVTGTSLASRVLKPVALTIVRAALARPAAQLFVENPDDRDLICGTRDALRARVRIIPGAGVEPEAFPAMPPTGNARPVAAYVGRMLRSKGVHVLAEAARKLHSDGVAVDVHLHGPTDDNPESIPPAELDRWGGTDGAPDWRGRTGDVAGVWRHSDICVMAPLVREGMPRAMLEAASCGRPLVVSDVAGCRHFVADGVNGLVVPPGNADALADAIRRLAENQDLAQKLGAAARQKLVAEYSADAVRAAIRAAYEMTAHDPKSKG